MTWNYDAEPVGGRTLYRYALSSDPVRDSPIARGGPTMHPFDYQPLDLIQAVILAVRCVLHVYSSGTPCVPI
ncbi:hypothetical protein [Nocardia sp. NPDC003345]